MQINSLWNHDVCVAECGFKKQLDPEDYFDSEKNLCCGTEILSRFHKQFGEGITAKKLDRCNGCCKDPAIQQQYIQYRDWAAALRAFNGLTCSNSDYVENVAKYIRMWGGDISSSATQTKEIPFGALTYTPKFSVNIQYDMGVYEKLKAWAKDASAICGAKISGEIKTCVEEKIRKFNENNPYKIEHASACEPKEYGALIKTYETIRDCAENGQTGCYCSLKDDQRVNTISGADIRIETDGTISLEDNSKFLNTKIRIAHAEDETKTQSFLPLIWRSTNRGNIFDNLLNQKKGSGVMYKEVDGKEEKLWDSYSNLLIYKPEPAPKDYIVLVEKLSEETQQRSFAEDEDAFRRLALQHGEGMGISENIINALLTGGDWRGIAQGGVLSVFDPNTNAGVPMCTPEKRKYALCVKSDTLPKFTLGQKSVQEPVDIKFSIYAG